METTTPLMLAGLTPFGWVAFGTVSVALLFLLVLRLLFAVSWHMCRLRNSAEEHSRDVFHAMPFIWWAQNLLLQYVAVVIFET